MGTEGGASDGEEASINTYATLAKLRTITHYTEAEISDENVSAMISDADRGILQMATILVHDEKMDGDIDGENKIFTTKRIPIADQTFNKTVTKDDVTVFLEDYDSEQNSESIEVEVATVNARDGIVTLVIAPTTTNAEIGVYVDYRAYVTKVDYNKLELGANYYLAHLCEQKIRLSRTERFTEAPSPSAASYLIINPAETYWLDMARQALGLLGRPTLEIME